MIRPLTTPATRTFTSLALHAQTDTGRALISSIWISPILVRALVLLLTLACAPLFLPARAQPAQTNATHETATHAAAWSSETELEAEIAAHEDCLSDDDEALETLPVELRGEDPTWDELYAGVGPLTRLQDVSSGVLLFETDVDGLFYQAPSLEQAVTIEVFGLIARTRVEQRFTNPTETWLEGIYVFPLPERSAVDELRLLIGDREVVGVIQERERAKQIYERAKASGRRASLVEQERPNLFTNSVANIAPHEDIVVVIEYQEDLRYDAGRISLRFPMVVAPRYNPGHQVVETFTGSGWGIATDRVPDAPRITPPVVLTAGELEQAIGAEGSRAALPEVGFADLDRARESTGDKQSPIHPVEITVSIDHALVLENIVSPSHEISVLETSQAYFVELTGPVPANRDFVLEWWPERRSAPQAAIYTSDLGGATYAHLMVVPPTEEAAFGALRSQPRELVLVIDTSGSMGGTSIQQAKAAALLALERLQPHDTFDVVEFNSSARALFSRPQPASVANVQRATRFVRSLGAGGGTNLLAALELALAGDAGDPEPATGRPLTRDRVRQVVFVTDGSVGNERELFAAIETRLADRRLFTVGIGSAPNHHFMRRAASFGRGTFSAITDLNEVNERMAQLFRKLETPALLDLEIEWRGWSEAERSTIEAWPRQLPDLYAGEPLVLNARLPALQRGVGELVLRGTQSGRAWATRLPIERGAERSGVDRLWAREKVRSLMDELTRGQSEESIRPQVVALGLQHHLVTSYTSLVAVDTVPARSTGEQIRSRPIPVQLPAGWDPVTTFGSAAVGAGTLPAGGTVSRLLLLIGTLLLGAAFWSRRRAIRLAVEPR